MESIHRYATVVRSSFSAVGSSVFSRPEHHFCSRIRAYPVHHLQRRRWRSQILITLVLEVIIHKYMSEKKFDLVDSEEPPGAEEEGMS